MLAALASSPATKALDPDPFPRHSLRHAVYAALLHFGFETAFLFVNTPAFLTSIAVLIFEGARFAVDGRITPELQTSAIQKAQTVFGVLLTVFATLVGAVIPKNKLPPSVASRDPEVLQLRPLLLKKTFG